MKLSMWILADWLEKYHPIVKIISGEQVLRNVRMLITDIETDSQNVYLASVNDYFDKTEGVICAHERDIIFIKKADIDQVFNEILTAFDFYNDWTDGLRDKVNEGCGLQVIIDDSIEMFKEPILILDSRHVAITTSIGYGMDILEKHWSYELSDKSIPLEKINKIIPLLAERKKCNEPFTIGNAVFPYNSYIRNLFAYRKHKGYVIIVELNKKSTKGRIQLFNELANILEYWLRYNEEQNELQDESAIFLELLEDKKVMSQEIDHKLGLLHWKKEDDKILIRIMFVHETEEISYTLYKYLENNLLKGCSIIHYKTSVIIIVNLRLKSLEVLLHEISPYLKKTSSYAGMSYIFQDISYLSQHNKQAEIALQYGGKKVGKIYDCKNYALLYGLSMINATITTDICHPGLYKLLKYDKVHNTEYYETLKQYLFYERSQQITAKKFGIHRNSLVYRIQKIEEIIEEDLEDLNIRLYLIFSFLMKQ